MPLTCEYLALRFKISRSSRWMEELLWCWKVVRWWPSMKWGMSCACCHTEPGHLQTSRHHIANHRAAAEPLVVISNCTQVQGVQGVQGVPCHNTSLMFVTVATRLVSDVWQCFEHRDNIHRMQCRQLISTSNHVLTILKMWLHWYVTKSLVLPLPSSLSVVANIVKQTPVPCLGHS